MEMWWLNRSAPECHPAVPGSNPASLQPVRTCQFLVGKPTGLAGSLRLASEGGRGKKKKSQKKKKKSGVQGPQDVLHWPLLAGCQLGRKGEGLAIDHLCGRFPTVLLGAPLMSSRTQGKCSGQSAAAMRALRASLSRMWALSTMPLLWGWLAVVVLWYVPITSQVRTQSE